MKLYFKILFCFSATFFLLQDVYAQKGDKIELIQAEELEGIEIDGLPVRKLRGNVIFKQDDVLMYCDSAYQYTKRNSIDAFGNVRINQRDTVQLTGDKLFYDGNTRKARVRDNVTLRDPQMTLTTDKLDYDLNTKIAYYMEGGHIVDGPTTLKSKKGHYNTNTKLFRFRDDVVVNNPEENFVLESDTLHYSTATKIATFFGPSTITSDDGTIFAHEGTYNTITAEYDFAKQAEVKTEEYTILGDKIHHDEKADVTIINGNVKLQSPNDSIIIESDHARHWGKQGLAKVYGNVLLKQYSEKDTLFLTADTLISIDKKDNPDKKLIAYPKSKIWRSDLQTKADSLVYDFADSIIYFYNDPVLWSEKNQISGDSIRLLMVNNNPDKMYVNNNSFIVSQDTIENFNQIKGRNMTAFFVDKKVNKVLVNGNAESIYYAIEEEKNKTTGMNKSLCSDMRIMFNSDNKLHTISFLANPNASFIPPHEIKEPETRLKGFKWRKEERPSREEVVGVRIQQNQVVFVPAPSPVSDKDAGGIDQVKAIEVLE
ncbi:OstA-like protein [Cytophagaceae bacterium ABcell3]|nr:OstA-like protein [Cytophagaceae bacterium ABcell3]